MTELTSLNIKRLDPAVAEKFRRGARIRGIPQAEYLRRLVELHHWMMRKADHPVPPSTGHALANFGLEPVREGE